MEWKTVAIIAIAAAGLLWWRSRPAATLPATPATADDAKNLAALQVTHGAKAVSEEGKKAILGETKAKQREADKAQRKG
jgi:hypothetical protein